MCYKFAMCTKINGQNVNGKMNKSPKQAQFISGVRCKIHTALCFYL